MLTPFNTAISLWKSVRPTVGSMMTGVLVPSRILNSIDPSPLYPTLSQTFRVRVSIGSHQASGAGSQTTATANCTWEAGLRTRHRQKVGPRAHRRRWPVPGDHGGSVFRQPARLQLAAALRNAVVFDELVPEI